MELNFRNNFFSSGMTEIVDGTGQEAGSIDLKSAFGTSLDIYGPSRDLVYSGKFRAFSGKWNVMDPEEEIIGIVRAKMSFLTKRYEYHAGSRGIYSITSPAFSKEYTIEDESGNVAATFTRTSGFFGPGSYRLDNLSSEVDSYEWIAVVMGVHSIQARQNNAANAAT
ncbi:hypothetical protein ACFSVM_12780 [Paenibacillus shunpengii]|uniref:Uncharacterized protein n=1 Tax=Paenibacillus shunpengii TaxID=2054424 RepID=A0ABW5SRT7_9BACL|nr:hypothetical protein [Paenibacillus sp. FSL H7-0326]OMC67124.1 hypothetical protein BK126_16000 [Paenibacillus sp. FSL H7-0326]